MNTNLVVSASIIIRANPKEVWAVLTDPEKIKVYLFGTQTITDWKVGSPILFQGEYEGQHYEDRGNVLEIKIGTRLKYNYWSGFSGLPDSPENYSLVTYQIDQLPNNQAQFTWTQEGFSSEEGKKHSEAGLPHILKQIKQLSEG